MTVHGIHSFREYFHIHKKEVKRRVSFADFAPKISLVLT